MAARKKPPSRPAASGDGGAFSVVVEELRAQFRVFGEALQGLREQMEQRFDQVDRRFEQVDRRFEQVDRELALVKDAFAEHGRQLKEHGRELKGLRGDVQVLAATKVGRDELDAAVERATLRNRQGPPA